MTLLREFVTENRRSPRILVRSANRIGDAVMTMPAIQRLRELEPDAHIALTCPSVLEAIWRHNPFLSEVILFKDRSAPARSLGPHEFDVAIIFPNSFRAAWECWRAIIPCRIGFAGHARRWLLTDTVKEARGEQFTNKTVSVAGSQFRVKTCEVVRHQIRRYLDIISYLGGNRDYVAPKIWLAPGELPSLTKYAHDDGRPFIAMDVSVEAGVATGWSPDRFAELAQCVSEEFSCRWLLFGSAGDMGIAAQIETAIGDEKGVVNVAGKVNLLESCALLRRCRLLVTHDTGLMHVAAALGVPVVSIFGPTEPDMTGPPDMHAIVVRERVECSPCFLRKCPIDCRCMKRVTVEQVLEAVFRLLRA